MQQITTASGFLTPSKIVCVGRNYLEHIDELNNEVAENMVLFFKPNSAITSTLHATHSAQGDTQSLHYEAEVCLLFQQQRISAVGIGIDLTKRDLQSKLKAKGLPWERAKAFDGSALFSEFVNIDEISDQLSLEFSIDGVLTQHALIPKMIYNPQTIISEVQSFITLEDGDIIMTGTPKGVGIVKSGSTYSAVLKLGDEILISHQWLAEN